MGSRWTRQDGNTLALFPAAVLVVFVLASMALDAAVTFSAQRQLADLAAGIANDAASAVADAGYFQGGTVAIDPVQARARVRAALARQPGTDDLQAACTVAVPDDVTVRVDCTGRVRQLVSPMRLLGIGSRDLAATATATAARG